MVSFDRPYTTFYWLAIVSIALSYIISKLKQDIGLNWIFHTPSIRHPLGGLCRSIAIPFGAKKLEWSTVKKSTDTFSHFDTILACNGQVDRQICCDSMHSIRRRRFWRTTHDCVAPYVDIILHRRWFWAKSSAFGERKMVMFQILLDGAEPRDAGTTRLTSPVCQRGGQQDPLGICIG